MDRDKSARIYKRWNKTHPWAYLTPEVQNIPLPDEDKHLRPPRPRLPDNDFTIFLGISSFRDGVRCGFTLFTAFSRATHPERLHVGLVDQSQGDDEICVEEYCKLAEASEWKECKYKDNIRVDKRNSAESKGPTVIRWRQQQLIQDEEFCLAIDAHSQFLPNWETIMVKEWLRADNEMAVMTSYPLDYSYIGKDLTIPHHYSSHLCAYNIRHEVTSIPIIGGMAMIDDSEAPQMAALWGGCLSFSKCHAERRAGNDKHMNWVFWGEEYLRSMQLWTRGYDLYSPSRHGHVVFHNWSDDKGMKKRFSDNVTQVMSKEQHDKEEKLAYNRLRSVLTLPFEGPADLTEIGKYYGGKVRTLEQYLRFSGISNIDSKLDETRCEQLHWVPYAVPEIIEDFLPGYKMRTRDSASLEKAVGDLQQILNVSSFNQAKPHDLENASKDQSETQKLLKDMQEQLKSLKQPPTDVEQLVEEIKSMNKRLQDMAHVQDKQVLTQIHSKLDARQATDSLLLPLAIVWLALISVWLICSSRRTTSSK
ncbi:hypothetical protein AC1031_007763 [Aphanomyces cochlioides]|nr:hypothetical protein AC1031_007763 [Aphanomyces cochlioides]